MRRPYSVLVLLGLCTCGGPLSDACELSKPTFLTGKDAGSIPIFDDTGRAGAMADEINQLVIEVQISCYAPETCFDNLTAKIVDKPIAWRENGEETTVMGYFDPNLWHIAVVLLPSMSCMRETAFKHELGHVVDMCNGSLCGL